MEHLPEHGHDPVMVDEVLQLLDLEHLSERAAGHRPVVMDCTAGRGGHLAPIAQALALVGGGLLVALDVDPENLKYARNRVELALDAGRSAAGDATPAPAAVELRVFHANFAEAPDVMEVLKVGRLDALLADFGVSTNQLLDRHHGLSFNIDQPLDMRLDPRIRHKASDLLASLDEKELAGILHDLAQERYAWRIARKIVQTRATEPILTTGQLARLVRSVVPPARHKQHAIDPATRTFQALRMAVNTELESIGALLDAVPGMMAPQGRAVFLSFHSGEDRLVKQASRQWEAAGQCRILLRKPQEPGEEEKQSNARSRSAKLRAVSF